MSAGVNPFVVECISTFVDHKKFLAPNNNTRQTTTHGGTCNEILFDTANDQVAFDFTLFTNGIHQFKPALSAANFNVGFGIFGAGSTLEIADGYQADSVFQVALWLI